jgi:hypothetical protein
MRNSKPLVCGIVAVASLGFLALLPVMRSWGGYLGKKPGSSLIELTPLTTISSTFASNFPSTTPVPAASPLGVKVDVHSKLTGVVTVLSAPTPSNGQVLDVIFQSSCDDGQTWNDFAHVQLGGTNTGTFYVPISAIAAGSTTVGVINDGPAGSANILSGNVAVQGPVGNRIRVRYYAWFGMPGTTSGTYTFQAYLLSN